MTPRPDWKMPPPPTPEHLPIADLESGDGWDLYWATPEQVDQQTVDYGAPDTVIPWPFGESDVVGKADIMALGFVYVTDVELP